MTEIYRSTWVVAYRDVLRFVRDRSRIFSSIAFPLLFLVIFGAGFTNVIGAMAGGINLVQFMYPGILAQSALITALVAGISVVTDREAGFLREILVAPLSRTGIVIGKTVGAAAVVLVQAGMLLVIAPLVGVPIDIPTVLRLLAVLIVLAFGLSGLGMLIAAFMRSQQSYQTIVQVLVFPLIFLAGVFFPVDSLPLWLQVPSKLNPVTYGVDAIRQIMLGSFPSHTALGISVLGHSMMLVEEIVVVGVLGLIFASAATWAFGRQE
jgi:ABC-2 type transport system permease protein